MALTREQRAEKIANKLFTILDQVSDLNDDVRDIVYTRTIEKLEGYGKLTTAKGVRTLRTLSLDM